MFYVAIICTNVQTYVEKLHVVSHCSVFLLVLLDVPFPLLDPHMVFSPPQV